jgi:hypothetical protein
MKELEFLNTKYQSETAEFIVLYGRRRIGKTALIREFVKEKPHIFYSAVQITDGVQLQKISTVVLAHLEAKIYNKQFSDWEMLFSFIADQVDPKEKLILVLDEFPYIVQGNSSVPSILQKQWDLSLCEKNVMIILCGSSMSFIEKELLSEKNPLYGRTTGIVKLGDLTFNESRDLIGGKNLVEQMNYYSAFSGVPYYLNRIDVKDTFENNIKKQIMQNGSVLFNEVDFLLKQELREVAQYNAIIESIALGDTRMNDIFQKTGIEKTKIPYYIGNLINLGVITREFPATMSIKEQAKSRSGIYKIDNSYFRFYYTFVYPYMSELMEGAEDVIVEDVVMSQLSEFVALEFEVVAIKQLRQWGIENKLPIRPIKIGRWWEKDQEIDIVAFDTKGNYMFGECKWRNEKTSIKVLNTLKTKSQNGHFKMNQVYYILFSKSGFTDDLLHHAQNESNVQLVDYSGRELVIHP